MVKLITFEARFQPQRVAKLTHRISTISAQLRIWSKTLSRPRWRQPKRVYLGRARRGRAPQQYVTILAGKLLCDVTSAGGDSLRELRPKWEQINLNTLCLLMLSM